MNEKNGEESNQQAGKPSLALTAGDPAGIGPEIVLKTLAHPEVTAAARIFVVGHEASLRTVARDLKLKWPFASVTDVLPERGRGGRPVLLKVDAEAASDGILAGQISANAGKLAAAAVEKAVEMIHHKTVDGIVTAPIHKEALALAGSPDVGHTEMLARLTGTKQVGMLFWSEKFSVALLTTHMSLREAVRKVTRARIERMLKLLDKQWLLLFGERPRIGVAALNPHAGEGGRFGVEEMREISPAIERAVERGITVAGPIAADTVFTRARREDYDVVLALYHDQATIPVKTLCEHRAVNVTIGLPFIRTSVDHGTAMDIAGRGIANEESLVQAILTAARLARRSE